MTPEEVLRAQEDSSLAGPCLGPVVLEAREVTKTYLLDEIEVKALCGVDLQVCAGEMLAIMGPSGSGKSTLMHIVGLLDRPSTGVVTIDGIDVSRMEQNELAAVRNKRIGFVFQSFNLLARTTAQTNVELPLIYAGVSGSERSQSRSGLTGVRRAGGALGTHAQPALRWTAAASGHRPSPRYRAEHRVGR